QLMLTTSNGDLQVLDLKNNKEYSITGVKDYTLSPDEKSIVYTTQTANINALHWMLLQEGKPVTIWRGNNGEQPGGYVFDNKSEQLAFNVQRPDGKMIIWYYKTSQPIAVLKVDDIPAATTRNLPVSGVTSF